MLEKGKANGTTTDTDGTFTLNIPGNATLVVSYVGYKTKEVRVNNRSFIVTSLIPEEKLLNEVVVVGFGKQKKESLVGAVQSVKPEDLKMTSSSLTTSFAGNVPGIIARQTQGEPGYDNAEFYIRGISTFGANNQPLIILDGAEITSEMLNNIPPESIESFSVLKDATATSLYGSRGANGVIIVNTRQGSASEKMSVNIRFDNTFSMPTTIQDMPDGPTYMRMFNEASKNDARIAGATYEQPYSDERIQRTIENANPYIFPNVNWYKTLFKDFAANQNLNINLKGGTRFIDYFLNAGIFYENGIMKQPKESEALDVQQRTQKYFFQSNVTARLTPTTKVTLNMNTQLFYYHGPKASTQNLFYWTMRVNPVAFAPVLPAEEGDTYVRYGNNSRRAVGGVFNNPYAELSSGYTERNYIYSTTVFNIDQDLKFITPGLKATAMASFYNNSFNWLDHWFVPFQYKVSDDYTQDADGTYHFTTESIGNPGEPYLKSNSGRNPTKNVWSVQGTLDYARTFGLHDVGATFVYHMKERKEVDNGSSEYNLLPYREQGLAGRLTYNFGHRYLMEATFGYNGSENFISGKRFGFFPAIALGWTVSNEAFFKPLKQVVSNLKIRGSYGLVGNDALAERFPYITTVDMNGKGGWWIGDGYVNNPVPIVTKYGNENATWEKAKKLNVGIDLSLFNALDLSVDVFREKRTGIFMQRNSILSAAGYGTSIPWSNIGAVDNKGVDMSISYQKAFSKDLTVQLNGSFTYAHNELTNVDEPVNIEKYYSRVGHPINSIRGLVAEGLFTSQEEIDNSPVQSLGTTVAVGDIKYKDLNGDNKIDASDYTTIGKPYIPEIVYGFGGTVKYKKWDFYLFFQGTGNVSLLMGDMHPFTDNSGDGYNLASYIVKDHWSEDNNVATAKYPRLSTTQVMNNTVPSSYYMRDASFLRLKNAEVGYRFTPWLRAYIAGSNLLTFSPFDNWDPEMGNSPQSGSLEPQPTNGLKYPIQRTVKIGVQFNY